MPTSVPHDDHNALPAGLRLGEFEIRRVLGSGGFGIVYVAFDRALEREVAIKEYMPTSLAGRSATHHVTVLSRSNGETFALGLRSFVNEAKLLARFDHPSLVKVLRFWEEHGTAYMAMPFYKGSTLKVLRQRMNTTPDEAWLRKVCEALLGALEAMHKEGVFHRDISPDNIVVDEDDRPVLLDFGAARRVINDKSQALTAILKPNYAPIEQYAESPGLRQGPWTDIYALGATLHFLVTGQPPMPATARALNDARMPLQHLSIAGLSKPLLALIDWMLAPRPDNRPRDVQQVRAALAGRLDIPAVALPTSPVADDEGDWPQTQVFERTVPPVVAGPAALAGSPGDEEDDPDATLVRPASWRPVALAKAQAAAEVAPPPAAAPELPAAQEPAQEPAREAPAPFPLRPPVPLAARVPPLAAAAGGPARPTRPLLLGLLGGGALVAAAAVYLFTDRRPEPTPAPAPAVAAASAAATAAVPAAASAASAMAAEAVTVIGAVPAASAVVSRPEPAASAPVVVTRVPVVPPLPVASAPAVPAADVRAAAAPAAAARLARAAASRPQPGGARTAPAASAVPATAALPAPAPSAAAALPPPTPRPVVVAAPAAAVEPERRDPNEACGGKMLVALHRCLMRECVKPEFTQHPSCARAREVERRTQESLGNN